ncbi:alpha/beta hydrolase [Sphingorhabdus sp. Alg239-R122]|uniref:alpha/beta hydrolase n=1 Tax=Sphingorhabdus sp. Alg239-R122 TaxID=2305989 RepID=UPI0013D97013|nr:alpha/beta hydrolase [Sphingorhabdus sp. Alg239-R122]
MTETSHLPRPDGTRLAYIHRKAAPENKTAPTLVFLPGYMSDMEGGKATALDAWAAQSGHAMLRFDYGGCGISEGDFRMQSLADWRDDALLMIDTLVEGPVILVGSSMGGWLMLLVALARPEKIAGIVGIAAAPDFTRWGFDDAHKAIIQTEGTLEEPSEYSDEPYVTTRIFWESGEANLLLDGEIALDCPVRLLHGQNDADVPWEISLKTAHALRAPDVQTLLIKDGDHRLSRDQDIDMLIRTVARLYNVSRIAE